MLFRPNFLRNIEYSHFFLATPDKRFKGVITNLSDCNAQFKLRELSQITFNVHDLEDTSFYKELKYLMKVYVENVGWFVISEEPTVQYDAETDTEYKAVTISSSEWELKNRYLVDFIFNTGEEDSINDCPVWTEDGSANILNYALEKAPQWNIGYIHPSLISRKPSLSYDSRDIYGFLNDELAKTLNCMPIFDTENNLINMYPLGEYIDDTLDTFGENTNIYISKQNLLNTFGRQSANDNGIITYINVYGYDDLNIRDANCGFGYLCDFTYYYDLMRPETKMAWIAYQEKLEENRETYSNAMIALSDAQERSTYLTATMKPDDYDEAVKNEDWKNFSLNELKNNFQSAYQERADAAKEALDKYTEKDFEYKSFKEQYDEANRILTAIKNEVAVREKDIEAQQAIIDEAQAKIDSLRKDLSWETNLTSSQIKELSSYISEADFTDETYMVTDIYTNTDIIKEKTELRDTALDKLSAMSRPQWQINTSSANIFNIPDFEPWRDKFLPGNYMTVIMSDDFSQKLRLIEIDLSFDDADNFTVVYSNMTINRKGMNDIDYLFQNASSASNVSSHRSSGSGSSSGDDDYVTPEQLKQALYNFSISGGNSTSALTPAQMELLQQILNGKIDSITGDYVKVKELAAEIAKISQLEAGSAFIDYLSATLITVTKLQAEIAKIDHLDANSAFVKYLESTVIESKIANIKNLLAGKAGVGDLEVINLTADNVRISEAVIKELIAANITVADLMTHSATAELITLISQNGNPSIAFKDSTQQFYDADGNIRIQMGQDGNGNFNFIIRGTDGKSVLLNENGITQAGIPDNTIITDMIGDKQVTEAKIDKSNIREWTDDEGNKIFDISKMYFGDDKFITSYESIQNDIKNLKNSFDSTNDNYNIVLSNDFQAIPCNSNGLTLSEFSLEIPFSAYKGLDIVPCEIEISDLPTGITITENTSSSLDNTGKIVLTVASNQDLNNSNAGNITFTCNIDNAQTIIKKFSWTKVLSDTDTFILYKLDSSTNVLKQTLLENNEESPTYKLTPSSITFSSYSQSNENEKQNYAGRFLIMESRDGVSYHTKYVSEQDESTVTYTPSTSEIFSIRCILCETGSITKQLDSQTITVLRDTETYSSIIKSFQTRFSKIELQIDNAEKSISQKASQQDIINSINDYDGTKIKEIRDQQAETKTEIGKITNTVSDIQGTIEESQETVTKLSEKVTEVEQTAESWKVTSEENKQKIGELEVSAKEISAKVTDNESNISKVSQKADELSSTLSGLKIGGNNLVTNSNDLIFSSYYFVAYLIDEDGNRLVDEDGNYLIAYY